MDCCLVFSQPGSVYLFCKRLALILSYLFWALSLGLAKSTSWRVWEFDSNIVPIMFIGLWETFYVQTLNVSGYMVSVSTYTMINESWVTPDEIYYAQNLVLLANFVTPVALVFASLAVWASWINAPYPDFFRLCYNIAASHLFFSCFCITLAVSWNFAVDIYGQTTLEFPPNFLVRKEMVNTKHISYVLPLGVTAASLSLISAVIFSVDRCSIKPLHEMKVRATAKYFKAEV
ncbi:uncharacterized protein WM277_010775 isoform 1-T1 [Molossus nigricans]